MKHFAFLQQHRWVREYYELPDEEDNSGRCSPWLYDSNQLKKIKKVIIEFNRFALNIFLRFDIIIINYLYFVSQNRLRVQLNNRVMTDKKLLMRDLREKIVEDKIIF